MKRRHFIKLTGGTLAGLAIAPLAFGETINKVALPNEVLIQSGKDWFPLSSKDKKTWTYKDVTVHLNDTDNALRVTVESPSLPLNAIVCKWPHKTPQAAMILNDHWERTYGDVHWQTPAATKKLPWYFLVHDNEHTSGFGVKTGCNSICNWQLNEDGLQLVMDTRSGGQGVKLGHRKLTAADIVTIESNTGESAFETGKRFCKMMCDKLRLAKQPVYGINDWYFAYGKNSSALILQHTALLADLATDTNNRPFSVVDAGWATYSPLMPDDCCWQDDYSKPNDNFKDMAKLAGDINKLGMRPGLWTRPLCAKHDTKQNLLLPLIPGRNDPKQPVLDPTIAENMAGIKSNIATYKTWGYEMVKHDFSTYDLLGKWGFQMDEDITTAGWRFNDNTKTNAEIILHLYRSIREAAGDMYLIGCNTVSHLSAGLFELNRIGDDTSGNEWERTRKMGVNTLAFRGMQHNHFYACDADCVGVTNKVPWTKNKQWMQLLAQSGTPLFISAQPDAVGIEQKSFIKDCFTAAARPMPVAEPLDWMTTLTPSKWKLNGQLVNFDWS